MVRKALTIFSFIGLLLSGCNTPGPSRRIDRMGTYSPDGRKIVFSSCRKTPDNQNGDWDVWVMDTDGSHQKCLLRSSGHDFPLGWSPSGDSILVYASRAAFLSWLIGKPWGCHLEIMDLSGSTIHKIDRAPSKNARARFHPNGNRLIWTAEDGLWLSKLDGSDSERICDFGWPCVPSTDWSRALLKKRIKADGRAVDLFALDLQQRAVRQLVRAHHGTLSSDGSTIAYVTPDQREIRLIDFDGQNDRMLAHCDEEGRLGYPTFSPDNGKLVYRRYRTGAALVVELWVINKDGANDQRLMPNERCQWGGPLRFSVDGTKLSGRCACSKDSWRFCIMNSDGTHLKGFEPVGDLNVWDHSFSPDGTQILYVGGHRMNQGLYLVDVDTMKQRRISPDHHDYVQYVNSAALRRPRRARWFEER